MFSISSHLIGASKSTNFWMLVLLYILPNSCFRETDLFLDLIIRNIGKWSVMSLNKIPECIGISNDLVGIFTKIWSINVAVYSVILVDLVMYGRILGTGVSSNILLLYFHWYSIDWCYNHQLKYKSLLYLTCSEIFPMLVKNETHLHQDVCIHHQRYKSASKT